MSLQIKAYINLDTITDYAKKNPEFIVKGKEDNKYGSFVVWISDHLDRFANDCSISISKPKDSKNPTCYVGNGISDDAEKKLTEKELISAKMQNKSLQNNFSNTRLYISLNLSKIRKYTEKNPSSVDVFGKVHINIFVNISEDDFGNDVSITMKKMRETEETIYVGGGKTKNAMDNYFLRKKKSQQAPEAKNEDGEDVPAEMQQVDDLPF